MTAYELMIKTNHHLIRGGNLNDAQKAKIARKLRENRATDGKIRTFDPYAYPKFYIPPYNTGKKLQTIIPMSPKTNIVADNAYEFEILRLLHLFQPSGEVTHMIKETKNRLKHTCFGYQSCHYAECFEAGMMVLRFLSFAAPDDRDWVAKQIDMYNKHYTDRRRHNGVQKYYWLILSDMPLEIAEPQILMQKEEILAQLAKKHLIKTGNEDVSLYAMRNALSRLPEYAHLHDRKPHVCENTGRHFVFSL
ncbi:MAG: hypothetical protein FWB80_14720 [Defluviitaleaceae bacterium]|nr:hypothetical protein [Defluviitaleaceae bacterium]MCL2200162.1 hypothetical protein [Defluviitaleaceae bacterium]